MNPFYSMFKKVASSPSYNQMLRFAAPLHDHFGINHFWYYRITNSGLYSYLGSHAVWNEFCFESPELLSHFPCLRDPHTIAEGIYLMKASADLPYLKVLKTAWDRYQINFNINLVKKNADGVEAFGFATKFNDVHADERLLNELPLLEQFTEAFRKKHPHILRLLDDHQIDLASHFGDAFYKKSLRLKLPRDKEAFLKKMGFESFERLSPREIDIVRFLAKGYPAPYIATELKLSKRTVENYIQSIKNKLNCHSKVELINKAHELIKQPYFQGVKKRHDKNT